MQHIHINPAVFNATPGPAPKPTDDPKPDGAEIDSPVPPNIGVPDIDL